MDWISILIWALSGALAAVLSQAAVGFKKERRVISIVVMVVLFIALRAAASAFVEPGLRGWQAESEIRKIPFYDNLAKYDPEAYGRVKAIIVESSRSKDSSAQVSAKIAASLGGVLPKYIPKASDDSVFAYTNWMVVELDKVHQANPDACYAFLYPQKFGEPGFASKYLDTRSEDDLKPLADIVESAITNPQPPPDPASSEELLKPVLHSLVQKYGADLALVNGTPKDSSERKKVCEIGLEMFHEIGALPKKDASQIVRHLLASKN